MNLFTISSFLVFITNLAIAIIVLIKSRDRKLSISWSFFCVIVAIWGFGGYKFSIATSKEAAFFWWQIAFIGIIFSPIAYLNFINVFIGSRKKALLVFFYTIGIIFVVFDLFWRDLFLIDLRFAFNQFYWVDCLKHSNPVYLVFYIFFYWFLLTYAFWLLIKKYKHSKGLILNQVKYFIIASIMGWVGGECMFLPAFRIDLYPIANFLIAAYPLIISYAIIRHHLLDISIVIQKSFIYSVLIALITATYFVFVLLTEKFFQGMVGYASIIISILYAFVIALFFNPVKNKIQHFADKVFLGKDPIQIVQENEFLRQEVMRSEKLKAVATFASGMAHEIKNPLTAIKTFSEYLPQKQNDPEFLEKFSKIVGSEINKIDDLVHQLLDFSKPTPPQLKETDMHNLIDETLELLSSQFIKYNIRVMREYNANSHESNISGNSCLIKVDSNQMKQVFLNLFLNAIDAMPSGGILTISTSTENPVSSIEQIFSICVQDTGCGIPEKDLPHIFEPFYTTKEKGSGLGLSIVYNIIKEHKGKIRVENKINKGTKFIVELPIRTQ